MACARLSEEASPAVGMVTSRWPLFDVGVAEAPVLTAEDDGDAVSLVQQGRDFFRRTFGREQSAPSTRPVRAVVPTVRSMGRERLRQRFP